jgi:hypothetical protein
MSSSSQVRITPDVLVHNEGTVFLFCPLTSQAKEWIDEHVSPDAQWFGSALVACRSEFVTEDGRALLLMHECCY